MNTAITQALQAAVRELYATDVNPQLSRPEPQFGDYATNVAMQLAKPLGKNPRIIAEELVAELSKNDIFEEVSVAGPGFLNVRVSAQNLAGTLEQLWSDQFGSNQDGGGKTVVVEYPSPNMAKPYSVCLLYTS